MSKEHYYLVIDEQHISAIQRAESPIHALSRKAFPGFSDSGPSFNNKGCEWRASEGRADHHYICYQFYFYGPMTGRVATVVDLGSINAYDRPGLPEQRMAVPCPQLRQRCPPLDGTSCAHGHEIQPEVAEGE